MSEDLNDTTSPTTAVATRLARPGHIPDKLSEVGWFLTGKDVAKVNLKTDSGDEIEINLGTLFTMCSFRDDTERVNYAMSMTEGIITGDRVQILFTALHMLGGVSMNGKGRQQLLDLAIKRSKVINVTENVQRIRHGLMDKLKRNRGSQQENEAEEDVYGR